MDGWIKIHYKFLEWEWFQEDGMVILFINLLLRANYQSKKWKGLDIERGQLVTGRKQLSVETGLSEKKVRTCLSRLEQTGEISIETTNKYSIITVSNYETYQINEPASGQQNGQQNNDVNDLISNDYKKEEDNIIRQWANKGPTNGQQRANKIQKNGQQNNDVNDLISDSYTQIDDETGQQRANKILEKTQKGATTKEYKKERIYKKETSTNVEEKKVELSFANTKKTVEERSKNFYQSLVPFVSIYSKEMVRAFFDYWTEPNRSKTKMKFELERTWDVKRRLNTWLSRAKIIPRHTVNSSYDIGTSNIENSSDKFKNTKKW